jgi:hypothetical protein
MSALDTARIYKEDFTNYVVWNQIVRELGFPKDTDEITVSGVSFLNPSLRTHFSKKPKLCTKKKQKKQKV